MRDTKPLKEDERPCLRREDCVSYAIGGVVFGFVLRRPDEGRCGECESGGVEGWTSVDIVFVSTYDIVRR